MTPPDRPRLPPGHPPWEVFAGIRIGAIVGAILGIVATLLTPCEGPALTVAGAFFGAVVGYVRAKWQQRMP